MLSFISNNNLRIIDKKIIRIKKVIYNENLTETRLKLANDKLNYLKIHRYGIIIREPLE